MVHFDDINKPIAVRRLLEYPSIEECVVLTTCNRVEIYIVTRNIEQAKSDTLYFLSTYHGIPEHMLEDKMYLFHCEKAAKHLFRVAAGLESMVVGESEILGQIKKDYEISKELEGPGPYLNKLFQTTIALGKEVRTKTPINTGVISLGSAAAKLAFEIKEPKKGKFGVIGCGEMGRTIAKHLVQGGAKKVFLVNRTACKAEDLAKEVDAYFIPFNKIYNLLKKSDIVISATSSPKHIITKRQLKNISKEKKNLTIIDIATPRDVEPMEKELDSLKLYTIDDLKDIVSRNLELRESAKQLIDEFIQNKLGFFEKWYHTRNVHEETFNNREPWIQARTNTDKSS